MFEAAVQWDGISIPRSLASFTRNVDETSGAAFTGNRETYMTRRALRPGSFLSLILNNGTAIFSESALVSEILHVKPSRPQNATKDYGKNLRHGFVKWRDDKVLIDTSIVYQPERKPISDVHAFLKKKLIEVTQETDGLSPYLKTSDEVIAEAERVQQSLFSDLIGDKKYAVLIGAIAIENKGDSAITIGEVMMLEKLQIELLYYINVVRCTGEKFKHAQELVASHATDDVVILMHGGGNLIGYGQENDCREKAFQAFPKHKTIILSQSFFMYGSEASVAHRVKMYCCNPELTILLRDRLSLHIAKRLFTNGTKLLLAPDMAYAIGPVSRFSPPVYDVVWLHRGDSETPVYKSLPTFPRNTLVRVSDWRGWTSPKGATTLETAHNMMMNGLLFLQRGRVVVTDRLHGHILCILLDIPHVLLDNADNKLSSYHNTWTRGLTNTRLTDNPQDAARLAMELLETYGKSLQPVVKPYTIKE
ncbi:hypothetical protein BaRGS_00031146 [Batillaria attramentaria]|uniref:Polysaccharide pyruvyl transferase domain-containing protein n=1 Tax=Batillaria attramentaria TaxID=370345 RepID=A0ABD0JSP6_9CAEN